MLQLRCAALDRRIVDGEFTDYDAKSYLAFTNSLRLILKALGLQAPASLTPPPLGWPTTSPAPMTSCPGMLTTSAAIDRRNLLGGAFAGGSWATWRAVLLAAEGLRLDDDQLARFTAVADRSPPTRRIKELWVIAGRRAGKDRIA